MRISLATPPLFACTGGQVGDNDCADDIKYVDLTQVGPCTETLHGRSQTIQ